MEEAGGSIAKNIYYPTFAHPTSPPACSVRQSGSWSILQTEQGEVGWANVWKTQGGAVLSLTNIYSLVYSQLVGGAEGCG